jgi:hypothetical protein
MNHGPQFRQNNETAAQMWARLRAMTNDEVLAAARKDPDARPLEDRDPTSLTPARHLSPAKPLRRSQMAVRRGLYAHVTEAA